MKTVAPNNNNYNNQKMQITPISLVQKFTDNYSNYVETFAASVPDGGSNRRLSKETSHMFRIIILTDHGDPVGYNYNCHLQVWKDGWIEITDNYLAGIKSYDGNQYLLSKNKRNMTEYTAMEFKKYISKIIMYL